MTKRFEDEELGVIIDITSAAEKLFKQLPCKNFEDNLAAFMEHMGADYAYVGASGGSLRVHLTWPPESKTQQRRR